MRAGAHPGPRLLVAERRRRHPDGDDEGLAAADLTPTIAAELRALRSRLRGRIDWDLDGAIADAQEALRLAAGAGEAEVSARASLGRALMMAGDRSWQDELERAADLAVEFGNVHEAATLGDTLIWGHLFTGDPTQCARGRGQPHRRDDRRGDGMEPLLPSGVAAGPRARRRRPRVGVQRGGAAAPPAADRQDA